MQKNIKATVFIIIFIITIGAYKIYNSVQINKSRVNDLEEIQNKTNDIIYFINDAQVSEQDFVAFKGEIEIDFDSKKTQENPDMKNSYDIYYSAIHKQTGKEFIYSGTDDNGLRILRIQDK